MTQGEELILGAIACIDLAIGLYVLLCNPRRKVHWIFFLFVAGAVAWIGGFIALYTTHNFFFDKIIQYAGLAMVLGLVLLAQYFPRCNPIPIRPWILYAPLVIAAIGIIPWNFIVSGLRITSSNVVPIPGPLAIAWSCLIIWYVLLSILQFYRTYLISSAHEKRQLQYFFAGVSIFTLSAAIFDAILPALGIPQLNLLGPLSSIIFVGFVAYAIARHQLLDIRIVIQRGIIYTLLFGFIVLCYVTMLVVIASGDEYSLPRFISAIAASIVSVMTVPRIERWFRKKTDHIFFKDRYEYSDAMQQLSEILKINDAPETLISQTTATLQQILRAEYVRFEDREVSGAELSIPIKAKKGILGVLSVGPKRSGDAFTRDDKHLLLTLAPFLSIALEKAELYDRVSRHARELEKKVEERTQHLEALRNHQQEMFADISHAVQTPLTVLKSTVDHLIYSKGAADISTLDRIQESVDRVSGLIYDLMRLSKLETIPETKQELFSLSDVIQRIAEYVSVVCEEHQITLSLNIESGIEMRGNKAQIEEVLTNFLSNAVRYTRGQPVRAITVVLHRLETGFEFYVQDTGIGIPKEALTLIFDRFYRVSESGRPGFGLGLAICKRIVERHGGTIRADSTPGKGARFTVRFLSPQV